MAPKVPELPKPVNSVLNGLKVLPSVTLCRERAYGLPFRQFGTRARLLHNATDKLDMQPFGFPEIAPRPLRRIPRQRRQKCTTDTSHLRSDNLARAWRVGRGRKIVKKIAEFSVHHKGEKE
jgi:hypothetical protein